LSCLPFSAHLWALGIWLLEEKSPHQMKDRIESRLTLTRTPHLHPCWIPQPPNPHLRQLRWPATKSITSILQPVFLFACCLKSAGYEIVTGKLIGGQSAPSLGPRSQTSRRPGAYPSPACRFSLSATKAREPTPAGSSAKGNQPASSTKVSLSGSICAALVVRLPPSSPCAGHQSELLALRSFTLAADYMCMHHVTRCRSIGRRVGVGRAVWLAGCGLDGDIP